MFVQSRPDAIKAIILANELDVRRVLHEQVSLAAVDHSCVIHENMIGCKNLKVHLKGLLRKCKFNLINSIIPLFHTGPESHELTNIWIRG